MTTTNAEADFVAGGIYIRAAERGELQIVCNHCMRPYHIFFEGDDTDATMGDRGWLATAITHLLTEHPEQMR